MNETLGNGINRKLNDAVESGWTKMFARVVLPVALAIIGYFMTTALTDLKTSLKDVRSQIWSMNTSVIAAQNDLSVKMGILGERVDDFGRRLDRVENGRSKAPPLP